MDRTCPAAAGILLPCVCAATSHQPESITSQHKTSAASDCVAPAAAVAVHTDKPDSAHAEMQFNPEYTETNTLRADGASVANLDTTLTAQHADAEPPDAAKHAMTDGMADGVTHGVLDVSSLLLLTNGGMLDNSIELVMPEETEAMKQTSDPDVADDLSHRAMRAALYEGQHAENMQQDLFKGCQTGSDHLHLSQVSIVRPLHMQHCSQWQSQLWHTLFLFCIVARMLSI